MLMSASRFLSAACLLLAVGTCLSEDICLTYAGGSVYPRETAKSSGHSLQWTKAMSKISFFNHFIPSKIIINVYLVSKPAPYWESTAVSWPSLFDISLFNHSICTYRLSMAPSRN